MGHVGFSLLFEAGRGLGFFGSGVGAFRVRSFCLGGLEATPRIKKLVDFFRCIDSNSCVYVEPAYTTARHDFLPGLILKPYLVPKKAFASQGNLRDAGLSVYVSRAGLLDMSGPLSFWGP